MKNVNKDKIIRYALISLVVILNACATSNDVVSNGLFQKRKYNKGWFVKKADHSDSKMKDSDKAFFEDSQNGVKKLPVNSKSIATIPLITDELVGIDEISESLSQNISQYKATNVISDSPFIPQSYLNEDVISNRGIETKKDIAQPEAENEKDKNKEKKIEPFGLIAIILFVAATLFFFIALEANLTTLLLLIAISTLVLTLAFSIVSLIRIKSNPNRFKGKGIAIISLVLASLLSVFEAVIFMFTGW